MDKTEVFEAIKLLSIKYTNDMDLGREVRKLLSEIKNKDNLFGTGLMIDYSVPSRYS